MGRVKFDDVHALVVGLFDLAKNVKAGADPIEAFHGHLCGPRCMHWDAMDQERRQQLLRAHWNADLTPAQREEAMTRKPWWEGADGEEIGS